MGEMNPIMAMLGGGQQQGQPQQGQEAMNPKQRETAMQMQQIQQAQQEFAPRLQQSLDLSTHLGEPINGPQDNLVKLLLMMKRMGGAMPRMGV